MIWERLVSNAVKEHWKKTGFEPCDGLKAAIIFNSPMSEGEKNAAYDEILCDMKDQTVIEEIRQVRECRERAYRRFVEESEGYVYTLKMYEEPGQREPFDHGIYAKQEYAYQYAMAYINEYSITEDFEIEKIEVCRHEIHGTDDYCGRPDKVIYSADGEVKHNYLSDGVLDEYEDDRKYFYDRFYNIPHPFKRGDIVKMLPEYGKAEEPWDYTGNEYYLVLIAKQGDWQNEDTGEYGDICIKIEEFNANTGRFYEVDPPTNQIKLEYADFDRSKMSFDDPAYMALYYMTSILSGKEEYCSLQTVQDACRCLRERHEEENKIKCYMGRFDVRIPYYEWHHT